MFGGWCQSPWCRYSSSHIETGLCPGVGSGAPAGALKDCAAPASLCHVPPVACTQHRCDRPTPILVVVLYRATFWWHHHPAALGGHEVANVIGREIVATLIIHTQS